MGCSGGAGDEGSRCLVALPSLTWRQAFSVYASRVSRGCPGIHAVVQAGLKLRLRPVSAPQVLGFMMCAPLPPLAYRVLALEASEPGRTKQN